MIRLLIQRFSDNPFGGELEEKGEFESLRKAIDAAKAFINDLTVETVILHGGGKQYIRLK